MTVGVLGFGGAQIGFEKASGRAVRKLLDDALDAGLNAIDTAECYLKSEELIGKAVSGRRDAFYLFTKCGHPEIPGRGDWRPDSLLSSVARSLKRLRTDRVDLVQLHSCSEDVLRRGDAIDALRRARDKGYARYIGYSGDGPAAAYAIESGAFDTLQTSVSLADQEAIGLTLPMAVDRGMGVIVKRPIANAAWRHDAAPDDGDHRVYWSRLRALGYDFLTGDPERAASTALRFTLAQPGVGTMIVGTARHGRWRENAALVREGPLPAAQVDAIRARWREVAGPDWGGLT